ncbi:MAG: polysaccharide deacetylase family protein, partial [Candidatus Obscuribacterales bacterium]|nr:polysaccharide deacetylase family protein [Candidatus Obscuribacterales bacterium]
VKPQRTHSHMQAHTRKALKPTSRRTVKQSAVKQMGAAKHGKKKELTMEEQALAAKIAAAKKAALEEERACRLICSAAPGANTEDKMVALTFDDGPSPEYTPKVLALLKEHNIHATFCLVGRQVKKYPELVKQIVAEGHKIANHTMNHNEFLTNKSDQKLKNEILAEQALITAVVPEVSIEYFRAPGGNWNHHIRKVVTGWGMKPLGWTVDSKDWQTPGVESIIKTVNKQLHPGGVILMHDAGGDRSETIAALKRLIPSLEQDGYKFGFPG